MARSMSSSFLAVLALTLVLLQGVLASIKPGRYLIVTEENRFLSVGPVPLVYPPMDVPARLLPKRFQDEAWEVAEAEDGGYSMRQPGKARATYGLVSKNDGAVIASYHSQPMTWSVSQAGDDMYTIGTLYDDLLFTQFEDAFPSVILRPADGSAQQRWRFVRIDRESARTGMYGKTRFNLQCEM